MFGRHAETILLFLMFFTIVISVRVFWVFPSKIYRRQFLQIMKSSIIIGTILGLILPWNVYVGLGASLVAALILLFIAVFSLIVLGRFGDIRSLHQTWVRRVTVRELLIVFSIISGLIGIIATILSIVIPPFLELSLRSEVPLAFDALSVTAALLDVTIPVTSYRKIYSLIFIYLRDRFGSDDWEWVNDQEFLDIIHDTEFTEYEVRDALENLVREGLAVKTTPDDMVEKVAFRISGLGYEVLRLNYEETIIKIHNNLERMEHSITTIADQTKEGHTTNIKELGKTLKHLQTELDLFYAENRCFEEAGECVMLKEKMAELSHRVTQKK
jgi:hypothetical protein